MKTYKYVVIGGGLAGGQAIEGIRESDENGSIALVADEPHRPYQRPPLSKGYLIGAQPESEVYVAEADRYDDAAITLLTGVRAERIDRAARTITLDDDQTLGYERLLLATGGRAKTLPIPGHDLENVFTLRTIEDSDRLRAASGAGKHALVLGAGFIGSEVAASLTMRDTQVTMAFPEPRLLARIVPEEMSAWLRSLYAEKGILILSGITPDELLGTETVKGAKLSNGSQIGLDMVVMGVGIDLNTVLAVDAGLDIREDDKAVIVNKYLQTSDPHIYAAGDIAAWPDPTFKKHLRVEHWDVAFNQGYVAGRNMAGAENVYDTLPYYFSDIFDVSYEVWGDLSQWDRTARRGDLADRSVAFYYFDKDELVGVLAMDRPDEERTPMQDLVKAKAAYEEIADHLTDEDYDLADLL
jgi:3-phenylpropionate/trans-cinnamate dioxygenase ferredoxin reductase component